MRQVRCVFVILPERKTSPALGAARNLRPIEMKPDSPVFFHRYVLRSRGPLNAKSSRTEFPGALIRSGDGFGCLHPWPELGDPDLEAVLADLAGNRRLALTQQALKSCEVELFAPASFPRSHFLLPPGETGEIDVPPGFGTVKLKCAGSDADLERIRVLAPNFRLRLDFNASLSPANFAAFWRNLGDSAHRVEFVEDPCPFHAPTWKNLAENTGCALALDRGSAVSAVPAVRIVKPAVQTQNVAAPRQKIVFTSYLDHPVGQLFAANCAATCPRPNEVRTCGLVTHHLFDDADPFIAAMGPPEPILRVPPNFTALLDDLPWKRLTPTC